MKTVLLVDNDDYVLSFLSNFLKRKNVGVTTSRDLDGARKALADNRFDLVITDIRLSGLMGQEGMDLLDYVVAKSPGTEVIVMTGYGSPDSEADALDHGAAYYIEKPIDLSLLDRSLRELEVN